MALIDSSEKDANDHCQQTCGSEFVRKSKVLIPIDLCESHTKSGTSSILSGSLCPGQNLTFHLHNQPLHATNVKVKLYYLWPEETPSSIKTNMINYYHFTSFQRFLHFLLLLHPHFRRSLWKGHSHDNGYEP